MDDPPDSNDVPHHAPNVANPEAQTGHPPSAAPVSLRKRALATAHSLVRNVRSSRSAPSHKPDQYLQHGRLPEFIQKDAGDWEEGNQGQRGAHCHSEPEREAALPAFQGKFADKNRRERGRDAAREPRASAAAAPQVAAPSASNFITACQSVAPRAFLQQQRSLLPETTPGIQQREEDINAGGWEAEDPAAAADNPDNTGAAVHVKELKLVGPVEYESAARHALLQLAVRRNPGLLHSTSRDNGDAHFAALMAGKMLGLVDALIPAHVKPPGAAFPLAGAGGGAASPLLSLGAASLPAFMFQIEEEERKKRGSSSGAPAPLLPSRSLPWDMELEALHAGAGGHAQEEDLVGAGWSSANIDIAATILSSRGAASLLESQATGEAPSPQNNHGFSESFSQPEGNRMDDSSPFLPGLQQAPQQPSPMPSISTGLSGWGSPAVRSRGAATESDERWMQRSASPGRHHSPAP